MEKYFLEQYESLTPKEYQVTRLQYYFLLTSVLFCLGYYFVSFFNGFLMARFLMAILTIWFCLLLYGIRRMVPVRIISHVFIFTCWLALAILTLFSDGIYSYVLPWLVLIPIVTMILTNHRITSGWVIICLVTIFIVYSFEGTIILPEKWVAPRSALLIISLHIGLILLALWLTYIFDSNQRAFIAKIEKQNKELVAIDEELRQSLEELSTTQELLAEREAESRSIVEALRTNFLITEFDKEGNIIYANQKVIDMTRSAPVGLNRFKHMDQRMRDTRLNEWKKIVGGESNSSESSYTVHGHTFWVMSTYAPIQNRLGEVSKILSVAHEITAAKKKEMEISEVNEKLGKALEDFKCLNNKLEERVRERTIELEEKNKYLAEYAFINSHLLRAPLCRLMGLIQLLNYTDISDADSELLSYLKMAGEELDGVVGRINIAIENGSYFDREIIRGNLKSI